MSGPIPDRMFIEVPGISVYEAHHLASIAALHAKLVAPKMSGQGAKRILPYWRAGAFGVRWEAAHMFYQEMGIKPFTMAYTPKAIPMWVDDADGKLRQADHKAKTKVGDDGLIKVLIFRKMGKKGTGSKSYPGAPGRIATRQAKSPFTTFGTRPGQIAPGNVGVKWRHPGTRPRHFLLHGILEAAKLESIPVTEVWAQSGQGEPERIEALLAS